MVSSTVSNQYHKVTEKVENDRIVLNGSGRFPRLIIILERDKKIEYRLVKTRTGKFQLSK